MHQGSMINGELFEKMIVGGVANLQKHAQKVNDLNVFPIPDGDTGENMLLTLQSGAANMQAEQKQTLSDKANAVAQGMLLGARGNSGVILSQLFYGLAKGLTGLDEADLFQFSNALKQGVTCAYGAVSKPVEGTILTVAREAAENACAHITPDTGLVEFFNDYFAEMKKSLAKTPDLLPVLKEAGVIDSGGAGLLYITDGFCKTLSGEQAEFTAVAQNANPAPVDFSKFNENTKLEYGYCTEILLQLQTAKTDIAAFDVNVITQFLETVGDSIVAFQTGTIVKIHVHTLTPWAVLKFCQDYGEYLTVKIENMTLQHNEVSGETASEETAISEALPADDLSMEDLPMPKRARRKFATVTVASGEGLISTFLEMGADEVISGGQTNNPSAKDFIKAFDKVNADCIFVLPNNGNVILAAKQAASIYQGSQIRVIESKNVGDGYSALSMLDYEIGDADEIEAQMRESMQNTVTGMVARAVRTVQLDDILVEKDSYMGFTDHQMLLCEQTKSAAVNTLTKKLGVADKEFLIVVFGESVTEEEKDEFRAFTSKNYPRVEVYEIEGGQDVYDFLLIVE